MRSDSPPAVETANDRFKRGFGSWFWIGLTTATLAHAALFAFLPGFGLDPASADDGGLTFVPLPDIPLPEPPEPIRSPVAPVIGGPDVDPELTIPSTDLEAYSTDVMPPPPGSRDDDLSKAPTFTPTTVSPQLENGDEVSRLLQRFYPPLLRDAGIGGTVSVWFFLDRSGKVVRTLINESSGYAELDSAALRVADRMRFSPAWNREKRVPVWVSIPILFEVR